MFYSIVLLIYLIAIGAYLIGSELYLKWAKVILWWALTQSLLKEYIESWYKNMIPHRSKVQKNKQSALIYYAAKDFVHLTFEQKFHVGFRMNLCDHFDAMRDEESLEAYIFEKAIKNNLIDKFLIMVRQVRDEEN